MTWTKAIENGQYITWPGLTSKLVRKHLPLSEETTLGHLHLLRQGIRQTATDPTPDLVPIETPTVRAHRQQRRNHNVGAHTIKLDTLQGMISTDITGSFPITSARVHKYIFVLYDYDSNAILSEPIYSRKKDIYSPATKLATPISTRQEYNPLSNGSTKKHPTYLFLKYKPRTLNTNTRQQVITDLTQQNRGI